MTDGPLETSERAINLTADYGHLSVRENLGNISQYSLKFYAKFDYYREGQAMDFFYSNVGICISLNPNGTFSGSQYLWKDGEHYVSFDILLDSNTEENVEKFNWIQLNGIKVTDINNRKKREESHNASLHKWILLGFSFDMQPYQQKYKFYLDGKFAGSFSEARDLATSKEEYNTLDRLSFYSASFSCAEFAYDVQSDDFFAKRDFEECSE